MKYLKKLFPLGCAEVERMLEKCHEKHPDDEPVGRLGIPIAMAKLKRHFNLWNDIEDYDKADGQHHLASVVFNAMVLLEQDLREEKE